MIESSHRLVGAYAADALDDAEREDFEAHLAECAECRAEAESLTEAAATLSEATAVTPPPELRASIMDQIATVRPLPPLASPDAAPEALPEVTAAATPTTQPYDELAARRTRRRRLVATVGSAAAAVVLAVSLGVSQPWAGDDLSPAQRVLQADDALSSSVDLGQGARATVVHSESIGQSVIQTEDMPPAPAGSVYQLWYAEDGEDGAFVSAGLMPVEAGDQTVRLQGDSREASGVGVTVEPEGGSDSPTSEPIAMFDFGPAA